KTIKVCATEDPVCSDGLNFAAHDTYVTDNQFVNQGVDFAAAKLGEGGPAAPGGPATMATAPRQGFGG
ncbi:cutinase family protein, partial [Mycobacterium sp. 050134]|uniref:cutinase family protein n=1 Tax=Mycobacterium sp. 050134 TaxID=3096111 RepID=UPI002ED7ED12